MKMRFIDNDPGPQPVAAYPRPRLPGPSAVWPLQEPQAADGQPAESKIDWAAYWRSVYSRRWPLLLLALVATVLAYFYAQSILPVYRSTATLMIESGKTKVVAIEEVYNAVSQDREYYQTQVEILRSRDVALRTVVATKLWDEPEFDPRKPVRSWRGQIKDFFSPPAEQPVWTPQALANATVGKYFGAVSIEPVRLSQLVKVSFEANDPELAAKVADATVTSFIEADRDTRLKLNLSVTGLLQERLAALRDKLLQSEQELQLFRERAGLVNLNGSQGVAVQQLADISQRLVSARVKRTELESDYQQVARLGNDPSAVSDVVNQPGLIDARNRVAAAALQLEDVSRTLGDQNSRVIEARSALAAAQKQLQYQTRAVVDSLRRQAAAARQTEQALEAQLSAARGTVQGVNRQEFQLGVLEREAQTNKQLYDLFLSRTKETSVSTNLQAPVARNVDPASPATAPARPNKGQIITAALVLSLGLGALACVLIDRFNSTLQGSDEAEQALHHPVLATLPAIRASEAHGLTRSFLDNPKSQHANAIRTARTNILLSNFAVAHKSVLVTSALAGEGKTTFCTNLAFAHAQARRTLLIDCDLRDPQIGTRLGFAEDAKGISNLVLGTADVKDCVHGVAGSSLLVMPAGDLPDNPEELLLSPQFRDALKSLANRVDVVLIDSPPLAACSDALIIAQQVNDTIFVVKARDTPHLQAQKGLERLRRAGASILGLVLSNVDAPAGRHAEYGYGYGSMRRRASEKANDRGGDRASERASDSTVISA